MGITRIDFNGIEEVKRPGYEWLCPECGEWSEADTSVQEENNITCENCGKEFRHEDAEEEDLEELDDK